MEYEDIPSRPIHNNAGRPDQKVLRTEPADDEFEMEKLLQDVDSVNRTLLALYPDMEIDPNMVFEQLEVVRHGTDRVFHVVSLLSQLHRTFLNNKAQRGAHQAEDDAPVQEIDVEAEGADAKIVATVNNDEQAGNSDSEDEHPVITIIDESPVWKDVYGGLVQDVNTIMDVFPDADPQEVYAYLEARRDEPGRVTNVIEELIHRNPVEKSAVVAIVPPATKNVPPTSEVDRKRREPPELEAYVHKKVRLMREMQEKPSQQDAKSSFSVTVDDDVQGMEKSSDVPPTAEANSSSSASTDEPSTSAGGSGQQESASQQLLSRLQVLKETFPDADRDYLSELINGCGTDEAKLQATVSDMLENNTYPKLKDQLERERKKALKKEYSSRLFSPEEVLQWFEDPIAFFGDTSTPVSKTYESHAYAQLYNEFPKLILLDIKKALTNNNHHYTAAFHELTEKLQEECKTIKFKRRRARATMAMPDEPDELFYKELAFTRIEDKFKEYLQSKETHKKKRMEEAKANGELVTCVCCFDDENLPEEMIDCSLGHLFCRECVRRGAEVAVGDGKCELECMSEKCGTQFELPALQLVLKPSTFSNLLKRIQAEEISNADIPDLVQCPHCSFAAIMPNQDDKVFRCLNPECLKETCRFCKEPNHIPLRCEEVEKSDEVKMRTYIEDKMTDALVRKCYRCSRRFMKEEGCNKMTCVCGATMCYVCRQPIKDYQHFQKGGCPQMSDTVQLHHDEVLQGAEKAKKEFVEQHPELKDTKLRHDPTKDLLNGEHVKRIHAGKYNGMVGEMAFGNNARNELYHLLGQDVLLMHPLWDNEEHEEFENIQHERQRLHNAERYRENMAAAMRIKLNHRPLAHDELQGPRLGDPMQYNMLGHQHTSLAVKPHHRPFAYEKLQGPMLGCPMHYPILGHQHTSSAVKPQLLLPFDPMPIQGAVDLTQRVRKQHQTTQPFQSVYKALKKIADLNKTRQLADHSTAILPKSQELAMGQPGGSNGVKIDAPGNKTNPASNSAIPPRRTLGSFEVKMKPAGFSLPNLERRIDFSNLRKRRVVLSKADSSSSAEADKIAPVDYLNDTAWNDDLEIARHTVPTANPPTKLHVNAGPSSTMPLQSSTFPEIDYSAGPSSRLNLTTKNANERSSASSLRQPPKSPTQPSEMAFEEIFPIDVPTPFRHADLATEFSMSRHYFRPDLNQIPVYAMPTVNNTASTDYQTTEPSTSKGPKSDKVKNWLRRCTATMLAHDDKSNAPSNQ